MDQPGVSVMPFGLSCCSEALIVLNPVVAIVKPIAVVISLTCFMVFSSRINVVRTWRKETCERWTSGPLFTRCGRRWSNSFALRESLISPPGRRI